MTINTHDSVLKCIWAHVTRTLNSFSSTQMASLNPKK